MTDRQGALDRARARAEADRPAWEPRHTVEAFVLPYLRHRWLGARLRAEEASALAAARLPAIVVVPEATPLSAGFLAHHRGLGVDHFLCLALGDAEVTAADDVSVVRLGRPAPRALLAAVNAAAQRWASGRWVLFLLANELFVYPHLRTRSLADLVQHLEDDRRLTLHAVTVDLYGSRAAAEERVFDGWGYVQFPGRRRSVEIRGGPGLRAFHAERPEDAPMLQRIALVQWRPWYHFSRFRQLANPLALNRAHRTWEVSITGGLLRHGAWPAHNGAAPTRLGARLGFEDELVTCTAGAEVPAWYDDGLACAYEGPASLVDAGLMSAGRWF